MFELDVSLITGIMFGLEFPDPSELDENVAFVAVLDIGIVRFMLVKWKQE